MASWAIVTGVNGEVGREIARSLQSDGWKVAGVDIDETVASTLLNVCDLYQQLNVGDESSVVKYFNNNWNSSSSLGALVNCAGVTRDRMLHKMSLTEWDTVMRVNLTGPFLMTRESLKRFRTFDTPGLIVNIASASGKLGNIGQGNYAASKAGLVGLTKVTARELAAVQGRANAVQPGLIDTKMTATIPHELLQSRISAIPLSRAGLPQEVASVVAWLCSDKSSYVTGSVIDVSGGRAIG